MKNEYKRIFDTKSPDNKTIEKIFEKTENSNSFGTAKRILCAALCFAVFATVGLFGYTSQSGNNITSKTNNQTEAGASTAHQSYKGGGVLVAYADTGKKVPVSKLNISSQPSFFVLNVTDVTGWSEEKIESTLDELKKENETMAYSGEYDNGLHIRSGYFEAESSNEKPYILTRRYSGNFALDIDDFSAVKSIEVTNRSDYGEVTLKYDNGESSADNTEIQFIHADADTNHRLTISGAKLEESLKAGLIENGYTIYWDIDHYLYEALAKNPNMDLSKITDKIDFTVNYKNGTSAKSTVNITFDRNGNMTVSDGGYTFE